MNNSAASDDLALLAPGSTIKAISLWQPWASLIAIGAKTVETRSWATSYRGPIAIHATKRAVPAGERLPGEYRSVKDSDLPDSAPTFMVRWPSAAAFDPQEPWYPLHLGAVVAVCNLVDVVPMERLAICLDIGPRGWAIQTLGNVPLIDPDQLPYGDYTSGRFAWLLDDIRALAPVPSRGRQQLWDWTVPEAAHTDERNPR